MRGAERAGAIRKMVSDHVPAGPHHGAPKHGDAWWRTDISGNYIMSIKFGSRPVELEKSKAGIMVQTKDKVAGAIDTLIAAVRAGGARRAPEPSGKDADDRKVKKAA